MKGFVLSVERCSLHDGPGVRTTVFLKGCPLSCLWCHNPESQSFQSELAYWSEKCVLCGACAAACPNLCHRVDTDSHDIDRARCTACGLCAKACPCSALEVKGYWASAEDLMAIVAKDRDYYGLEGGLTVSGGEPLAQSDFTYALCRLAKEMGFHTAIETSGFAPAGDFARLATVTDLFLYDYKESDPKLHANYTGVSPRLALDNLAMLNDAGAGVILRCPIIPGFNDRQEHFPAIAALSMKHRRILEVNVMPYHPMGKSKCHAIGREYPLPEAGFPPKGQAEEWVAAIQRHTDKPVKTG